MKEYIKKEVTIDEFANIVCDICKKSFRAKEDWTEVQEFHCIEFMGGYGSIFGDGVKVSCDICQHCLHVLIGGSARFDDNYENDKSPSCCDIKF